MAMRRGACSHVSLHSCNAVTSKLPLKNSVRKGPSKMCLSFHCRHSLSRRDAFKAAARFAVMASLGCAEAKEPSVGQPAPNAIGADAALGRLMNGNARYVANRPTHRDFSAGRAERAKSQYPIAAVLSCSDSRVAPDFAFDQGPGDIFVVRVAGNFANDRLPWQLMGEFGPVRSCRIPLRLCKNAAA